MSKSKNHKNYFQSEYELSEIMISFKELINQIKAIDIYSGKENIPFREKDEEFQRLLLSEFKM